MSDPMADAEPLDDYRARLDGAIIATYVFVMLIVPAKIYCRISLGGWTNVRLDDYLSVITLALANGFFWIVAIGLRPFLGRHVGPEVSFPGDVNTFLRWLTAASLTYICAIAFIKYTILAFYWRLFSVAARIPIGIICASVVAWQIIFICLGLFSCRPINAAWDVTVPDPKCMHQKSIYLGGSLPNVIVDFILVLLPLPYVWRLHTSLYQRLILASMFALGLFICIVSIVRLTIVMAIGTSDNNVTYNLRDFMLWSTVEVNIGLVCACLPSMRQFLKVIGLNRIFSSIKGSSGNKTGGNTGGPSAGAGANPSRATHSHSKQKSSRGGSKSGILSSLRGGFNKFDNHEDGFQMIDSMANSNRYGKSQSQVEAARTSGESVESGSSGGKNKHHKNDSDSDVTGQAGISVQRDWSVRVDDKPATVPPAVTRE